VDARRCRRGGGRRGFEPAEDTAWRTSALADVAKAVAAADPERAEAIARSIEDKSWRSRTLASLVRLLSQPFNDSEQ
jgi:hypothetical protein